MAKKILVIDDEEHIVEMVKARLSANGYEVATAANGKEGLEKVKTFRPNLIVLDVLMPVMDGFQFIKALKKEPNAAVIPIVMLTCRGLMKDTFEMLEVDAFIVKPFEAHDLLATIRSVLQPKILLFSKDEKFQETITSIMAARSYGVSILKDETELAKDELIARYKIIVLHLPFIRRSLEELTPVIRGLKAQGKQVLICSDSRVKGLEHDNNPLPICEAKVKWLNAGAAYFFDSRIVDHSFTSILVDYLS